MNKNPETSPHSLPVISEIQLCQESVITDLLASLDVSKVTGVDGVSAHYAESDNL